MKWLTLGFILFLVMVVILADSGNGDWLFRLVDYLPGGDKTGHFILIGTLTLFVNLSLKGAQVRIGPISMLKGSLIIAAVFTVEEFSQLLFESRGFSLLDLAANYLGILVFGRVAVWLLRRQRHPTAVVTPAAFRED